jgi:hypothetical protein
MRPREIVTCGNQFRNFESVGQNNKRVTIVFGDHDWTAFNFLYICLNDFQGRVVSIRDGSVRNGRSFWRMKSVYRENIVRLVLKRMKEGELNAAGL